MLVAPLSASMVSAMADTVVFVDGTRVRGAATSAFELQGLIPPGYDVDIVPYPAQTWPLSGPDSYTAGYSVQVGVDLLAQRVPGATGCVLAVGGSLGAMTLDQFLSELPSNTPAPERLSFAVLGDPYRGGILAGIAAGTRIPVLDIVKPAIVDTPYDVTVVQNQYDGIGDFPDIPGNWISVVNAILGAFIYHNGSAYQDAAWQVNSGHLAPVSVVTNLMGGVTATYVVPRALPITVLLKQLGVPSAVVDGIDEFLKPIVEEGYSRSDPTANQASPQSEAWPSMGPNLGSVDAGTSMRAVRSGPRPRSGLGWPTKLHGRPDFAHRINSFQRPSAQKSIGQRRGIGRDGQFSSVRSSASDPRAVKAHAAAQR
jgi:hypothetical protein